MDSGNNSILSYFRWSNEVIIITLICLLIMIGTILLLSVFTKGAGAEIYRYIVIPICIIVIWLPASFMPRYLSIDSECVKLQRLVGSIKIPLTNIRSVETVSSPMMEGSIRLFGSGGFFGYFGIFKNKRIGKHTVYATEWKNLILIKTDKKNYIFSCRAAKEFETFFATHCCH